MTDRELIELAAKASGRRVTGWTQKNGVDVAVLDDGSYFQPIHENDITSADADAFRLAVELSIDIEFYDGSVYAEGQEGIVGEVIGEDQCQYAATRRAITRAAVETM